MSKLIPVIGICKLVGFVQEELILLAQDRYTERSDSVVER